jgi:membrane-bound lytic murein transglycosylase B
MNVVARTTALAVVVLLSLRPASATADAHRGWGWLVEKLVADGLDRGRVEAAFDDPRMDAFDGLDFSLSAREPRALYRGFLRRAGIAAARRCREEYGPELDRAAVAEGVPASIVAAIMYVESGCGRNTGSSMILHRLARLAMANEPANLSRNLAWHAPDGDPEVEARVRARARYLEDTFYPEVRGVFLVADRLHVDPLALHGSGSGAFGAPQFLPTSYLEHGVDGDGDGRVDLYDPADAARSCASYLKAKGWREGLSAADRRRVIWAYNRSDAYIDAVLAVARAIDRPATATTVASSRGDRHHGKRTKVATASRTKKAAPPKKKPAPIAATRSATGP